VSRYTLTHLGDDALLREGAASARNESASTALLLAHIGEIDARHLYADQGYDSMAAFCTGEWGLCEFAAYRRIGAARITRRFPALFEAVADGRLNLTTLTLLGPALAPGNVDELVALAAGRTKRELQDLLAARTAAGLASAHGCVARPDNSCTPLAPALVVSGDGQEEAQAAPTMDGLAAPTAACAAPSWPLRAMLGPAERDDLEYLKALLSHVVPDGNLEQVLGRVFRAAIRELERRKFAVSTPARAHATTAAGEGSKPRHIPRAVRRAVFERDGGRCTFTGANGHRCESRWRLELDHVVPVAKGGESTTANLRLRCRTHNQHAAERAFGTGFMERKREEAKQRAAAKRGAAQAREAEHVRKEAHARELAANAEARARAEEVIPWLRTLGVSLAEARKAAATCEAMPGAPLEQRVRHALKHLAPPGARTFAPVAASPPI